MGAQPVIAQQSATQLLPVYAHSAKAFRDALSDTVINWNTIGKIILTDPGLMLQTFRQLRAGSKRATSFEITGMSQMLMLMGVDRVKRLTSGLPILEKTLTGNSLTGYNRTVNRAYHAAFQARNWAQWRNDYAPEEVFIATLLYSVPELVLWINAPEKMQQLRRRIYKEGTAPLEAEQLTLGQSLREIWLTATSDVQLPAFVQDVHNPETASSPREQTAILALQLANLVEFGWYTEKVDGIIEQVAHYLNKHPDQATRIIHINAVNIAHDFPYSTVRPAAALLPLIPTADNRLLLEEFPHVEKQPPSPVLDGRRATPEARDGSGMRRAAEGKPELREVGPVPAGKIKRDPGAAVIEQPKIKPQGHPQTDTKISAVASVVTLSPQPSLLAEAVQRLEAGMGKLTANEIIQLAVNAMQKGIGFHRVVFAALSSNRLYLEARCITGGEFDPAFNQFKVKLDKHNLFGRILEKPSSIWINDENRTKYWQSIPSEFKVLIKTNSFCVMSVHLNGKAVGLFYADRCSPDNKIDKQSFTLFRHLGLMAARCLASRPPVKKSPS